MHRLAGLLLLAVALTACGTDPDPTGAVPVRVASVDGPFELTLIMPRSLFRADEPITGEMRLGALDGLPRKLGGSGGGILATSFTEVSGTRRMEAGWDLSCGQFELDPNAPLTNGLVKSGGWDPDGPDAAFYDVFFTGPEIRLPPGTWDVSARAWFSEGECGGPMHDMTTTARIVVRP